MIAIAICALMLFFAVGSKVAWYHSKERAARPIAATKVWQAKTMAGDFEQTSESVTVQTAIELVFLFSLCLVVAGLPPRREHFDSPLIETFAALAMRPPPIL